MTQITKKREVSIALPGPTIRSHQPSEGSSADEAACADGERPVNGFAKAKERLDKLTGAFDKPWVIHDLRRTVRTNLGAIEELDKETRERMVAHSQGPMSKTYDLYDYAPQKRRGFQLWAARLATILRPPHRVVALRR